MGSLPGHVQPLDSMELLRLEPFSERLTRFHEDAAPRQQRAARVPCDTLSGNAAGEQQASEDAATATCPDSDARGSDMTTSTSNNKFAMTSETTCPDDALTDADAAHRADAAPALPQGKTMMLRNIPCSVTQEELEKVVRQRGCGGRSDFVYVPPSHHRRRTNLGYAPVNLIDEASADAFKLDFDGFRFPDRLSEKVCEVEPARLHGRVCNTTIMTSCINI